MKTFFEEFGIDLSLSLVGMAGSLIMVGKRAAQNLRASILGIISGTLSANYLTPLVISYFELEGKSQFGVAFLLGYFGLKGIETLTKKIFKNENDSNN
jgi:hypothetical protein